MSYVCLRSKSLYVLDLILTRRTFVFDYGYLRGISKSQDARRGSTVRGSCLGMRMLPASLGHFYLGHTYVIKVLCVFIVSAYMVCIRWRHSRSWQCMEFGLFVLQAQSTSDDVFRC
ncbi:hypothetical protein K7X08_000831 [Anisodus acutangulus]|uniref:Transmembrane protein n=1 Tax=Anisodus acutangulus TaxID=402998 RepID=A0A9Q1MNM8_9SOLA|nr:hypothetical protein K7X08_000831 [Anisodus acutangulus]